MRILHVVSALNGGGAERFVTLLAPHLAQAGTTCGIVSIYPSEVPKTLGSVEVIQLERRGRYDAASFARMCARMRAWRPDVVHGHMSGGTFLGRLAAIVVGTPVIVRTEHAPCASRLPFRAANVANRALNQATDAVVTFSRAQALMLARRERLDPRKLVVIPNGIEHDPQPTDVDRARARALLHLDEDAAAIVVLGNLHFPKNQRLAIEACAALPEGTRARTRMLIVGDGPDRSALEALVSTLGIAACVRFLGYRTDVGTLLAAADAFVMPSLTEGLPLAMLEAMSFGVPVITTPWTGAHDLLAGGDLGTIARDYSAGALARGLLEVLDDALRASRIARRAQAVVRAEYDISTSARRHLEMYGRLLARRPAWVS